MTISDSIIFNLSILYAHPPSSASTRSGAVGTPPPTGHTLKVGAGVSPARPVPPNPQNVVFVVLSKDGKNQRSPGTGSEECKHSSRLPPDPITGDASLGPFLASGAGGAVDCPRFPAAAAGWAIQKNSPAGREKTRLEPAAVEAGADTTGGWYPPLPPTRQPLRRGRCPHRPAVNCPAKQHGTGQAAPVGAAGPILRHARAQWPGRRGTRHSNFARRTGFPAKGAAKNGVLVPLPPWAKEPAAGAAESSFCGRMRTSAPTEKPAAENIKKRERPERPLPCFVFRTGAEAKRSFAGNSFAYFSFQEK